MMIPAVKKHTSVPPGKKILCSGLVMVVGTLVVGGALYCLLTQPHITANLTPQGPIGFH
jgi:uncharacterized membrane protein YgdD (TMEM256/DUF423 family)